MGNHLKGCAMLDTNDPADCWCEAKRYWYALAIGMAVFVVEVAGGFISGSSALLSDAVHVLADNVDVSVAIIVVYASKRSVEREGLIRKLGAYVGLTLLSSGAIWIIFEALGRFITPREVVGMTMLIIAIAVALGNVWVLLILSGVSKGDQTITHKVFNAHVISDLLVSIVVIVSAGIITATEWKIVDPLTSLGVGAYILVWLCPSLYREIKHGEHGHHHHHH